MNINKNFEDNVVLTSQYPGTFLTFTYDGSVAFIEPSIGIGTGILYINGWDASYGSSDFTLDLSANINIASFYVYTENNNNFEYNIQFNVYNDVSKLDLEQSLDVSIFNRPFIFDSQELNAYETYTPLVDDLASYLLLRTNPKYTGNIKLVIDTSENLYLDTFKVSEILSNKKYRKQAVSGNSFLSGDIRRVFESLPIGEIYRVDDEDTLDIANPKTEYYDQYNTTYNYGAQLFKDELYDENFSILAPLWINTEIPDYFAMFRMDGVFNSETYDTVPDLTDLAKNFISDSSLFKSWNLKDNTEVGIYLNSHLSELNNIKAPVSLSLNEYDPNTWYGIAVDKGIITGRSEVPYFFEKTTNNFTDLNAFVSQGFERQNLLCPNLLNLEFVFNDPDVSLYSMHRYFGIYLNENELYKIAYYKSTSDSSVNIISLDENDSQIFLDSSIFNSTTGNIKTIYQNRIFVLNTGNDLRRISNVNQIDGNTDISTYVNKLGKNLFTTTVTRKTINKFISFNIENLLAQGEHLRIVDNTNSNIWEIYGTGNDILEAGEAGPYVSFVEPSIGYPNLYRTTFSTKGTINNQITAIQIAFDLFKDYETPSPFSTGVRKSDSLSIMIDDSNDGNEYLFQRITAQTLQDPSTFNAAANYNDLGFYNSITLDVSDFNRIEYDALFGPINFELYGDRMSMMINFIDSSGYFVYAFDNSIGELFTDNVLYKATDNWNRKIQTFDISTGVQYSPLYVEDPDSLENNAVIFTENVIVVKNNIWAGYDVYPLSISLMGINPVKDIDYTVYDSSTDSMDFKSDYWYKRENDASTYEWFLEIGEKKSIDQPNSYEIISGTGYIIIDSSTIKYSATDTSVFYFNTFFNDTFIGAYTPSRITYNILDGSQNFTSYDNISEEDINDYYIDSSIKRKLKYGLTVPTISKWGTTGRDCRNNQIRLNLTTDFFDGSVNTNFIPYNANFSDEVSYPVFKYLDPGTENWEDYIYFDINDVVNNDGTNLTLKELMFAEPTTDVFSKILYSNYNVTGRNSRSSILYYDIYKNEINTIIKGIKLGLKVSSSGEKLLNVKKWDKYRFSLISTPSVNRDNNYPIEVIINENTKTVLMIWYQGNDILNYSKRNSSYLPSSNNLIDNMSIENKNFYGFLSNDPSYSYTKAPFRVNTASVSQSISNTYGKESDYDSSICAPFAQQNWNEIDNLNSIFNAWDSNSVSNTAFSFSESYDTFNQNWVDYTFFHNSISYGPNITNKSYIYANNYNYYYDKTSDLDHFSYIINSGNIKYYIIQNDILITSDQFNTSPIIVSKYNPIVYKSSLSDVSVYTYNGSYKPIFKNILNFTSNEDAEVMNILEKDFIFSNTNLETYNNFEQYWFNKVVETVSVKDSSNNILYASDFNPFKSLWDNDYYVLTNGAINTYVDGFNSSLELPSLFGSKLIALPDELILESWDGTNSGYTSGADYYLIEYNLTKSILDLFTNNITFINNWSGLTSVSDDIINRYIIKTVLDYYNISLSKIEAEIWNKPYDGTLVMSDYDLSLTVKLSNAEGGLYYEKNEYIYKIKVNKSDNRSYYSKFTFNKK